MVPIENEKTEVGVDLNEISNIVNDIHLPEHNKFDVPDQLFDDELGFNKFEPPSDPIESPTSSSPPSVSGHLFCKVDCLKTRNIPTFSVLNKDPN